MKTIREMFNCEQIGGKHAIIVALEAREKERDAAEQERVKSALKEWVSQALKGYVTIGSVLDAVYPPPPPPEPAKLKAGYYWYREPGMEGWLGASWICDFVPKVSIEYRPWNDPPPEVTGKAEPDYESRDRIFANEFERTRQDKAEPMNAQFCCCVCEKTFPMEYLSNHRATMCQDCYVAGKSPPKCPRCNGTGEVPDEYDPLPDDVI